MRVEADMKFVGVQKEMSKNNKPYYVIGLLQGFDSERIFTNEETYNRVYKYPSFCDVHCTLNIRIGQERSFVSLEDIYQVGQDAGKTSGKG